MEVKKLSVDEITPEQFIEEHWNPGIPLVFKDASRVWEASRTFTPDWFREHYGEVKTNANGTEYTMREVHSDVILEPREPVQVKGKSQALQIFCALGLPDEATSTRSTQAVPSTNPNAGGANTGGIVL